MPSKSNRYIRNGQYVDPPNNEVTPPLPVIKPSHSCMKHSKAKPRKRDYKARPASDIFKQEYDWNRLDRLSRRTNDLIFTSRFMYNDFRSAHTGHHLKMANVTKDQLDKVVTKLYFAVTDMMDELGIRMPDRIDDDNARQQD